MATFSTGATTRTTALSTFKEILAPRIAELVPQKTKAFSIFSKSKETNVGGKYWREPFRSAANQAAGISIAENELLPLGVANTFSEWQISPKYMYGAYSISGPALRSATGGQNSWMKQLKYEADALQNAFIKRFSIYLYGIGTGLVGRVTGTSGADILQLRRTGYDASNGRLNPGAKWIQVGDRIAVHSGLAGAVRGVATVTAIDEDAATPTVTCETAFPANSADGDGVYIAVTGQTTSTLNATPMGLTGICDDGTLVATFQNITRSGNTHSQGIVMANAGTLRSITTSLFQQANDKIRRKSGGTSGFEGADLILMSDLTRQEYVSLLESDVRFQPQTFKGGHISSRLSFAYGERDLPIDVDIDCPEFTVYFLNKETLKYYEMYPLQVLDDDGIDILRSTAGYDAYEARMGWAGQFGCNQPQANCILTDLSVSGVSQAT